MAKRATEIILTLVIVSTVLTVAFSLMTDKMVSLSNHNHIITLE